MSLFTKVDQFIFTQLTNLRKKEEFNKIESAYAELDDDKQMYARYAIIGAIVAVPLLIIMLVGMSNSSQRSQLEDKLSIIETANSIVQRDGLIKSAERKHLGPGPISTQDNLVQKLSQSVISAGGENENYKVLSFVKDDLSGNIVQFTSEIEFKEQTNKQIFSVITNLKSRLKVKIDSFAAKRNSDSKLVNGVMTIAYYWKSVVEDEEENL